MYIYIYSINDQSARTGAQYFSPWLPRRAVLAAVAPRLNPSWQGQPANNGSFDHQNLKKITNTHVYLTKNHGDITDDEIYRL